jgi:dihydrodipicolinate synthase/N-acetylneuraminate lyase
MNHHRTILTLTSSVLVVVVTVAVVAGSRAITVEARTWRGDVVVAVAASSPLEAVRLARAAKRHGPRALAAKGGAA